MLPVYVKPEKLCIDIVPSIFLILLDTSSVSHTLLTTHQELVGNKAEYYSQKVLCIYAESVLELSA